MTLRWPFTHEITFNFYPHLLNEVPTNESFELSFEAPCEESRFMGILFEALVKQRRFSFVRHLATYCVLME